MTDEGAACAVGTAVTIDCAGPAAAGADKIAGDAERDEASEVAPDESRMITGGEADDTGVGSRACSSRWRESACIIRGGNGTDSRVEVRIVSAL
jgi:hypothetical protein